MSIIERPTMKCDGPDCKDPETGKARELPPQFNHSAAIKDAEQRGWVLGVVPVNGRPADLCPECYEATVRPARIIRVRFEHTTNEHGDCVSWCHACRIVDGR